MTTMYEREDWTQYRSLTTLCQKAGVPQDDLPALVAKELADNALDACKGGDECEVGLLADGGGFWVADFGEGFDGTDQEIADLFSIKRPMRSSKLIRLPTRGALGNGLRVVAGAVLASNGSLVVHTRGRAIRLVPQDDGRTRAEPVEPLDDMGNRIEVRLGEPLKVNGDTLCWARQAIALAAGRERYKGRSSPFWYDSEAFYELLRSAPGGITVRVFMEQFDGCTGPNAMRIAAGFKMRLANELTREDAERLLSTARHRARDVNPGRLGQVGPSVRGLPVSHAKVTGTIHYRAARGEHDAEVPFVLEAFAEVGDFADFHLSVNRTPIAAACRAFHDKDALIVSGCGLHHKFAVGRRPMRVWLNIETPFMPLLSDGKMPDMKPFLHQIAGVLQKAAKRAKKGAPKDKEAEGLTTKDIILRRLGEAVDLASDGGVFRFSIRQLYYALRPFILKAIGKEPQYDYFSRVISDREVEEGDIKGMYREPRGTLYHPHTREEIQLGTMQVEKYRRPEYTFNKVLYCEKEGIFPTLKAAGWPERHDCMLMTSKGFPSRAARDLIDLLGDSDNDLWFFCLHDADPAGTMIHQSIQEATRARPGRRVRIINLGLDPEEAIALGLQVEDVERKAHGKRQPVADYIDPEMKEWLQSHRVELNAMRPSQLIAWLDGKMAEYVGKVVPPGDVLAESLEEGVRARLTEQITQDILRQANIAERVEREYSRRQPAILASLGTLEDDVRRALDSDPERHWTAPVDQVADRLTDPDFSPLPAAA
jgi:hypothetical protein